MIAAAALILLGAGPPLAEEEPGDDAPAVLRAYDEAALLRKQGQHAEAARRFVALADAHPNARRATRALTSAAEIHQWQTGDLLRAAALYDRVLAGPDERPGVRAALEQRLFIERERGGARAELQLVHRLYATNHGPERGPVLLM